VLIADSEGADELEESAVQALLSRGVDKFIYATLGTIVCRVPDSLRDRRLVLMNNIDPTLSAPAVIPDDHRAGRVAAETLAAAGHTTGIWLVGRATPGAFAARKRLAGVRAGLRASGLRLAGHVHCGWWPGESRRAVTDLLGTGWWATDRPTAVIAMNDRAAMGVYQALAAAGLRVPDDLSVVSFDNSDLSRWLHPALSTMDLPYFDIGRRAVELLIDEGAEPRVHKLAMELRSRDSVAAPAAVLA
jgi:LacI family transcriptional regulator